MQYTCMYGGGGGGMTVVCTAEAAWEFMHARDIRYYDNVCVF